MATLRKDVFTLPEGIAVCEWPSPMSATSYKLFKQWIDLVITKAKNSSVAEERSEQIQEDHPFKGAPGGADA